MKIEQIELHHIQMPLIHPFRTSFGIESKRPCILVEIKSEGITGWGECVMGLGPWYSAETVETAWHILQDFLIPSLLNKEIETPDDITPIFKAVQILIMLRRKTDFMEWRRKTKFIKNKTKSEG